MVAPTPISCSVPGCTFTTPAGAPNWEVMSALLNTHAQSVHAAGGGHSSEGSSAPRLEKLPRPSFQLDMSQAEWAFKHSQWRAYISQTQVSEEIKVQQLRAACEDDLLRRVYDAGDLATLDTEAKLVEQIKKISVRVVHKTRHLQNMWAMTQSPEESIRAFVSRLVGTAELCDMFVTCSKSGCTQRTSYRDEVVKQALLRGMHNGDIRTRVLSRTQNEELKTLVEIVDYIAAEEASTASFSNMSDDHTIAGTKSSYKQLRSHQHEKVEPVLCRFCGGKHPGDMSPSSRQQHCKAFNKKCSKCAKQHHFAVVCQSAPKTAAPLSTS